MAEIETDLCMFKKKNLNREKNCVSIMDKSAKNVD